MYLFIFIEFNCINYYRRSINLPLYFFCLFKIVDISQFCNIINFLISFTYIFNNIYTELSVSCKITLETFNKIKFSFVIYHIKVRIINVTIF